MDTKNAVYDLRLRSQKYATYFAEQLDSAKSESEKVYWQHQIAKEVKHSSSN